MSGQLQRLARSGDTHGRCPAAVRAFTSKCYCEWEMLVTAVVDGKDQVFSVKDGDRPFRTTAFATAYKTIYSFDFFGGNRFVKLPPGSPFPPPQSGP
jgi:hypothetical protein